MPHETVCYIQPRDAGVNMERPELASWQTLGLFALALLLLMTPSARSHKKNLASEDARSPPAIPPWVESTLRKMTLREKLGQMLMPYYFGVFTSTDSAEYKELLHQVRGQSRGRLHYRHHSRPARHRAQPGISHGRAHERTAAPLEDSAAHRRGFRNRHGNAPRRRARHFPSAMASAPQAIRSSHTPQARTSRSKRAPPACIGFSRRTRT